MKTLVIYLLVFLSVILCCNSDINSEDNFSSHPKNIILLIGDGMGISHVNFAIMVNDSLNIQKMPYSGYSRTSSASNLITESGAGGTAIATGFKTYNGAMGVGIDSLPLKSILEIAEGYGLSTGLISTSSITHATPAAFIAHQKSRSMEEAIALDFLKTDIDLFIGGGKSFFANRSDNLNLLDSLISKGYSVVFDTTGLKETSGKFAALLSDGHMPKSDSGRMNILPLSVEKAISELNKNTKGFFLMIEGSQIDWASHNNDSAYLFSELIDFDKAVGKALDFAKQDGNTLVIVTADHETGGLILKSDANNQVRPVFTTTGHTASTVPVFAYGPCAENFSGIYENTAIFFKMKEAFNFR